MLGCEGPFILDFEIEPQYVDKGPDILFGNGFYGFGCLQGCR